MVLVFGACAKDSGKEGTPDATAKPTEQTPADTDTPDSTEEPGDPGEPTEKVESKDTYIINTVEDYYNRPKQIQKGTEVTLICTDVPSQLPWNAVPEGWLTTNIYEGLLYLHLGSVDDIRGLIAESWEHSDDYLTWTFHIRDGVKFWDGTVCDAAAVVKSWDFYNEASPASFTNIKMESWEATGDMEVTVKLSAPCSYFEASITRLFIVSPTALQTYGINDNKAAVGTGPYILDSYTSGVGFVLKANPDYYFEERTPHIETINFNIIKDENTKMMALLNGDIDGYQFSAVESFYNLKDNGYDGTIIQNYGNANPFFFNAKTVPEFEIFEVRQAFVRFIDLEAINMLMYDDMGLIQKSLWTVGSTGDVPFDGFYYDKEEGLELMASAGVDPASMAFTAKIIDSSGDLFVTIAGQLEKVGIKMDIEPLEPEANFTFLMNGDWTITAGNSGYGDASPYGPWTYILRPEHLIKEVWSDIYNPELYQQMLDTYDKMITALTWDEMLVNCRQLTTYLQEDYGAMNGIQAPWFAAFDKSLKCLVFSTENHFQQLFYMYKDV